MNKQEIIAKINILTKKVKTPGRAYSKIQREEMRKEISNLSIELNKIKFQEDLIYISELEIKCPDFYQSDKDLLLNRINGIADVINGTNLKRILKIKLKSFYNDVKYLEYLQKEIAFVKEALTCLDNNERIPTSNSNWLKDKVAIQKTLAANYKSLTARIIKLKLTADEINQIKIFFDADSGLLGFVFVTDPVFTSASNFDKGYAIVEYNSNKMYFANTGNTFNVTSHEIEIYKIEKQRSNPKLIPFETGEDFFPKLYGYKNADDEIIIPAKFRRASPFINGFAKVGLLKRDHMYYGLIDSQGRFVLPCEFFELGDVYNDIVLYKKHKYRGGYVWSNSFNYDMQHELKHLGLFSGYLKFDEIKPAIHKEIEQITEIESKIPFLKTDSEIDFANEKIENHWKKIDFYFKYIIDNDKNI